MTKVEQLEQDIMTLSRLELAAFRDWFQSYLADQWDKQIELDARAGKLDSLASEAIADHQAGRTRGL